jgi:hypothetical protein
LIDKSGSMAGDNIRLAREAAIAAAETLEEGDAVGVIAFDIEPKVVLEPTPVARMDFIRDRIAQIGAHGGTNIHPALEAAHRVLRDSPAQIRHVILLSDGVTQVSNYPEIARRLAAARITLSAICVASGFEFDATLMNNLATWGGGRFYFAQVFSAVPQIFTRETQYLVDQRDRDAAPGRPRALPAPSPQPPAPGAGGPPEIALRIAAPEEPLRGLEAKPLPPVGGLVPASARPGAVAAVAADDDRPALALGRSGLGRTAAWTADFSADGWGRKWTAWESFPAFAAQLVRSLHRRTPADRFPGAVTAELQGGTARVRVDFREAAERWPEAEWDLIGAWSGDGEGEHSLALRQVGAAAAEGEFPAPLPGQWATVRVGLRGAGRAWAAAPVGIARAYPDELRSAAAAGEPWEAAAAAAGIRIVHGDPPPPAPAPGAGSRTADLSGPLLIAALLLLPVDVALRRIQR